MAGLRGTYLHPAITERWQTAEQIAKLRLAGLPTSAFRVREVAKRQFWRHQERPEIEGGTLYWLIDLPQKAKDDLNARYRKTGKRKRARRTGRPRGTDFFSRHPDVAEAVLSYRSQHSFAAKTILELLEHQFERLPTLRTLQRHLNVLEQKNGALLAASRDPAGYKNRFRLSLGTAGDDLTHANQRWEIDTTPGDVQLLEGRLAILGVVDVYTRRTKFLVAPSESGQSVRRLLAATMTAWGATPDEIATDNGSGYVNKAIVSALELLGIEHKLCPPATPEKKPFIERVFQTFQHSRAEMLAGFCGHNVAEAQRLRDRARARHGKPLIVPELSAEDFQEILDNWTEGPYLTAHHSGIGTSPLARWQQSPTIGRGSPSEDELKIVLSAYVGPATVGKRGIQWKNGRYWSPALSPYMGRTVNLRRDEDELGELMVFDEDNRFIGLAINHERAGISEKDFAVGARRAHEAFMASAKADLRQKMRRYSIEDARDAVLKSDAEKAGKLTVLPIGGRDAPSETVRSIRERPEPQRPTTEQMDAIFRPEPKRAPTPNTRPFEELVAEADGLIAAAIKGEDVDDKRLRWAKLFIETPKYTTHKVMRSAFPRDDAAAPPSTRAQKRN